MVNRDTLIQILGLSPEQALVFSLRDSKRAKRLIFNSSMRKGFEVVLPRSYNDKWVIEAISKRKSHIKECVSEIAESQSTLKPESVSLPVLGKSWKVLYKTFDVKPPGIFIETTRSIKIQTPSENSFLAAETLQKWLHSKASFYLPKRLEQIACDMNLSYNKVKIKGQKTIWGSCSVKHNINLNRNLMLLPEHVIDYVLHHELVHVKIMDHQKIFWKELNKVFPTYRESIKTLKLYEENEIPYWALIA